MGEWQFHWVPSETTETRTGSHRPVDVRPPSRLPAPLPLQRTSCLLVRLRPAGDRMAHTGEDLAGASLARQFPDLDGRDATAVAETVRRIGPIQAQTARSPFLALAARLPGVTL